MSYKAPFATKERLVEYLDDFFAEIPEGYQIEDVVDAIMSSLDGWIEYHTKNKETYETVRTKLRERICAA